MSLNSKTYFILNNTWNIFNYVFRIFGVYPCVRDEENNCLKPRSTFCIWAHFICTNLIMNQYFIIMLVSYIESIEKTSNEFLEKIYYVYFRRGITAVAMISNVAIYTFIGFICLHKLRNLSIRLSEFQYYYNNHTQLILNEEKISAHMKKQHLYTLLFVLVWFCGLILMYISASLELNLSLVSAILYIFGTLISSLPILMAVAYFILIYIEIIIFLSIWCDSIKNIQFENSLIKEAKIFIDGLDLISNIFSSFLFWITFASLLELVIYSYSTFATFWDRNNFHLWQFYIMAIMLMVLSFMIALYGLCTFSESMAKKVKLQR